MYGLLSDLTVIEGASFIAGPSCGLYLAQMGATVIRFDQRGGGPDAKRWPLSKSGESFYWQGMNKNKLSIGLDFSQEEGRVLAKRLATSADGLFVTNFPEAGFLSYDKLQKLRSDLICLRVMGWADGLPAVDYTVNASIGVPNMTGPESSEQPVNHVLPAWDLLAGGYGAFSLLAAERDRMKTGKGREIRVALSDLAASTMGHLGNLAEVLEAGADRPRYGNDLFGAFGRDFETADGERLIAVAITPRQWKSLLKVLGLIEAVSTIEQELGLSFLTDEGARFTHRERLLPLVSTAIASKTLADLAEAFDENGVTWSRYQSLSQAYSEDPRFFTDNPVFSSVNHPGGHSYPTPGAAARIPGEKRIDAGSAPVIGQNTDQILADYLGMSDSEIGVLRDKKVVG
ncbi:MAG: CoA transferase [Pseudomonadales bacterium]